MIVLMATRALAPNKNFFIRSSVTARGSGLFSLWLQIIEIRQNYCPRFATQPEILYKVPMSGIEHFGRRSAGGFFNCPSRQCGANQLGLPSLAASRPAKLAQSWGRMAENRRFTVRKHWDGIGEASKDIGCHCRRGRAGRGLCLWPDR